MAVAKGKNCSYISKWMIDQFSSHPDFQASGLSMSIGTSGSYDIIQKKTPTSISSQTSGGSSTYSYLSSSFTIQNMTGEYYQVQINITPETYSNLLVNSVIVKTPSLTCSTTSTITFTLASYNGGQIPSWVSCNSVSGVLTMNTPNASSSTNYMFYINADVPGTLSPIQKLITIGITQCLVSHWDTWSSTDTTVWITWSYFLCSFIRIMYKESFVWS